MKKSILILATLGVATSLAIHLATRPEPKLIASAPTPPAEPSAPTPAPARPLAAKPAAHAHPAEPARSNAPNATPERGIQDNLALQAAVDVLVSPKATFADRQAAWKEIRERGMLQDAANELEQRMKDNPDEAAYPAALGQAYLKLCATTEDVRSRAVWAMTADRMFDTAIALDPSNWDARYTKAVAMTYWPADLHKGDDVVQQFNTLIQQQEQKTPQPQFAQTYEWLGKFYDKNGQPEQARQVWERGAALYPNDSTLRARLAAGQTAQQ
ncbi:MAG TPA: tetratricopeptide repeat protein [Verrucomicrobiae bacterium]|jgi:tetratricopeptide (TPR) repeat protein|nr:tetratricopeptide repeat protein [Verrucomicrobiae bacterium]